MASWHALSCGISWPVAICIDYDIFVGLVDTTLAVKGRKPTGGHHIDRHSVISCPGYGQPGKIPSLSNDLDFAFCD